MAVSVTGGAGSIGSHATYALPARGGGDIVLDNRSTGRRSQVGEDTVLVQGEVADQPLVRPIIQDYGVDIVMHSAGSIVVPDSAA